MEVLQAITTRRSIRKYTDEPVSDEALRTLLNAALCAPTARNLRPWHFLVLRDAEQRSKILSFHPYASMVAQKEAVVIVVCGDLNRQPSKEYCAEDCSAAVQNILLAAHGMGLGAVWMGMYPNEDRVSGAHEAFGIPQDMLPAAMVCIGHPAERRDVPDRYEEERIHWGEW